MAATKRAGTKRAQTPPRAKKRAARSPSAAKTEKSRQTRKQAATRTRAPRKAAAAKPSSSPPPAEHESAVQAVERALAGIEITAKRAVAAATVRRLAVALDAADPGDVPKVSRELHDRMAELLVEVEPDAGADKDWTEGSGPAPVRDTPKP